ncbi:hypothetical protein GQ43DRAFT_152 [Delitschia confertaspora ATCC 74209]|uniref:DUF7707 domain-containing protein n=1 Tax=Delitschia confertaspora ATCC 74209 TaxID=1513339 RepID=A0A9P4N3Q6_9PLEO|nr:hypothetical protein GQ43DRAFT_152 [Delitschia confertaspora ATCC 74209]
MFYSTLLLAFAALSSVTIAQNISCCSIDAGSVPPETKREWCQAERNTCPEICGGIGKLASGGNNCDINTLEFTCECADGRKPNMSDYQQSVPGQMCLVWFDRCIQNSGSDIFKQEECKSIKCGNKTTEDLAQSSSSSAVASSTPTGTTSGSGDSPAASTSAAASPAESSGAAVALAFARELGTPVLAAGVMAAFGLAL